MNGKQYTHNRRSDGYADAERELVLDRYVDGSYALWGTALDVTRR